MKTQVFIGTRIPLALKKKLSQYCVNNGVKIGYFISQAINEKLDVVREENALMVEGMKRLNDAELMSQNEFNDYLRKRDI